MDVEKNREEKESVSERQGLCRELEREVKKNKDKRKMKGK